MRNECLLSKSLWTVPILKYCKQFGVPLSICVWENVKIHLMGDVRGDMVIVLAHLKDNMSCRKKLVCPELFQKVFKDLQYLNAETQSFLD
jgi:hypothetical protein